MAINRSLDSAETLFTYAYAVVTSEILSKGSIKNRYELVHNRSFVKASSKEEFNIVRPNNDNLYSSAWTQLKNTPYILEVPDIKDRYVLVNYLDMKTDIPFSVGSKNPRGSKGKYIFVYRDSEVPAGYEDYTVVRAEDSKIHMLVRLEAFNEQDYPTANAIQDQIIFRAVYPEKLQDQGNELVGLSTEAIEGYSIEEFYKIFVSTFADTKIEPEIVELIKTFGINVETGSFQSVSAEDKKILEQGREKAYQKITSPSDKPLVESNGWSYGVENGIYGKDYLYRAQVAYFGYGANLAEDSIYPQFNTLPGGVPLYSDKQYRIHFEQGKLPEAQFFWSITLYGKPSQYLTENELDRYMINSHDKDLFVNEDGSIDILLSNSRPEDPKKLPNWLPTPLDEKEFDLTMRIYGPTKSQLAGTWEGPIVEEIS